MYARRARRRSGATLFFTLLLVQSELRRESYGTTTILRLDRYARANTLTTHLCDRLGRIVKSLDGGNVTTFFMVRGSQNPDLERKLVVSELDRVFCTGADLEALHHAWTTGDRASVEQYYTAETKLINTLVNVTTPWAAALDGVVTSAGAGLAMHALFRLACSASVWALPETSYGSVPTYGSSFALPHLDGELGTYLALTGRRLVGHDLYHAGLASHFVSPESYAFMCQQLSSQSSQSLDFLLPVMSTMDESTPSLEEEPFSLSRRDLDDVAHCFKFDSVQRIGEALAERATPFARRTRERLAAKSPASLALTLRLLREGQRSDDAIEALRLEHAVMMRLWRDPQSDLHAGLRQVVLGGQRGPVAWTSAADEAYVERMVSAPGAEDTPLELAPQRPRPAYEAAQIKGYYADHDAVMYDQHTLPLEPAPVARRGDERTLTTDEELAAVLHDNQHKLLRPVSYYAVQPRGPDSLPSRVGDERVARVAGTRTHSPIPSDVLQRMALEHGDALDSLEVVRYDHWDVHPELSGVPAKTVKEARAAMRAHFGLPASVTEAAVESNMSIDSLLSMGMRSVDEEADLMLQLAGHKIKSVEEVEKEFDTVPNYDGLVPVINQAPLTAREEKL